MDYKELHTQAKEKAIKACMELDNEKKQVLCDYLKTTVEFMERELADQDVDWCSLPYFEKDSSESKAFEELNELTIGWKYASEDIIELDKEVIALLEQSLMDALVEKLSDEYSDMRIYISKDSLLKNVVCVEMWVDNDSDVLTILVKASDIKAKGFVKALTDQAKSYGNVSTETINEIEQKFSERVK